MKDRYIEKDVEDAIMREMENFILELGVGFTFVARQKRIQVDSDDFYLDLLFYHRGLRCLVAIDLKLRDFQPGDKGQMEFYLRWLAKYEQKPGEESPIGLILCAGKKREQSELLELEKSGIRVASYWTKVLPRKLLQQKLHEAIQHARERLTQKNTSLLLTGPAAGTPQVGGAQPENLRSALSDALHREVRHRDLDDDPHECLRNAPNASLIDASRGPMIKCRGKGSRMAQMAHPAVTRKPPHKWLEWRIPHANLGLRVAS